MSSYKLFLSFMKREKMLLVHSKRGAPSGGSKWFRALAISKSKPSLHKGGGAVLHCDPESKTGDILKFEIFDRGRGSVLGL